MENLEAYGSIVIDETSRDSPIIDKSMFIKTVFQTGRRLLITAPSKFCKTVNLYFMRDFLSMRSTQTDCFKTFKIYENNGSFYKENFHSHPVLFLDCTVAQLDSYDDAVENYKWAIHRAFLEHDYLLKMTSLDEGERELCRSWCDRHQGYKNKGVQDVLYDLSSLVSVIKRNCQKDVVVLVDEYDCVVNKALNQNMSADQFKNILQLTRGLLQTLLDNVSVSHAVLTGISCLTTARLSNIHNLEIFPFLGNHQFVEFFGLTESELEDLFSGKESQLHSDSKGDILNYYGYYRSINGRKIYNLSSVLKFIRSMKIMPYWKGHDQFSSLMSLVKYVDVSKTIAHALNKHVLNITMPNWIVSIEDVMELKNMYLAKTKNPQKCPLLLPYLFELGLFTYNIDEPCQIPMNKLSKVQIVIPNAEVHDIISYLFQTFVVTTCNLPMEYYRLGNYLKFDSNLRQSQFSRWKKLFQ